MSKEKDFHLKQTGISIGCLLLLGSSLYFGSYLWVIFLYSIVLLLCVSNFYFQDKRINGILPFVALVGFLGSIFYVSN